MTSKVFRQAIKTRCENILYSMGASAYDVVNLRVIPNRRTWASFTYAKEVKPNKPLTLKISKEVLEKWDSQRIDDLLIHECSHYFGKHKDKMFQYKAVSTGNNMTKNRYSNGANAKMKLARNLPRIMGMFE